MLNFGERLKEERVRLGYNQGDFASLAGVAKTSQFNYEKGERSPDAAYLAAVAVAGVDVLYIVTGERKPLPADSLSAREAQVLAYYRQMAETDRAVFERTGAALARSAS